MKVVLDKPLFIAHNPSMRMGAYLVESDTEDIFQSLFFMSDHPVE
jgi:hypothetical protein